eukprot:gene4753-34503_t
MGNTSSSKGDRGFQEEDAFAKKQFADHEGGSVANGHLPTTGPLTAKDYKSRLTTSEGTQNLFFPQTGYTMRYAFVTQRGLYPDAPDKANQDSLCVHTYFGGDPEQALFGVFDGHGEYGTQCSQYAKDKVPENLLNNAQFAVSPESAYHRAMDPNVEHWGTEEENDGDPPRLWAPNATYPGTAFTRSIGDSAAERIGVFAEPEVVSKQLTSNHPFLVIASDGVWEFLPSQSVIDMVSKFEDPQEACLSAVAESYRLSQSLSALRKLASVLWLSRTTCGFSMSLVSKFEDPQEACLSVVAESYRLWLQHETRTDDITMMVLQFMGLEDEAPKMALPTPLGATLDYSSRPAPGMALRRMHTPRVSAIEVSSTLNHGVSMAELNASPSSAAGRSPEELRSLEEAVRNNFLFMNLEGLQRREVFETFEKRFVQGLQRREVFETFEKRFVQAGELVIRQGEPGDHFYIVEAGQFDVYLQHPGAKQPELVHTYLSQAGQKASFGELALLYSKPRAATVIARTDGMLWSLHRIAFKGVLQLGAYDIDLKVTVRTLRIVEGVLQRGANDVDLKGTVRTLRIVEGVLQRGANDVDLKVTVHTLRIVEGVLQRGAIYVDLKVTVHTLRIVEGVLQRGANDVDLKVTVRTLRIVEGVLQRGANDVDLKVTVHTLRSVEVLRCLSISHLHQLAEAMSEVSFEDGEYIIQQGEQGRDFFLIQSGEVVCTVRKNPDDPNEAPKPDALLYLEPDYSYGVVPYVSPEPGHVLIELDSKLPTLPKEVLRLSTGQYFGERALLTSAKRAANVKAIGKVQLLAVSRHCFERSIGPIQVQLLAVSRHRFERSIGPVQIQLLAVSRHRFEWSIGPIQVQLLAVSRHRFERSIGPVQVQLLAVSRHRFERSIGPIQEIIDCENNWKDQLALQRELLARKNTTTTKVIQGSLSLDAPIARGLLLSTDCTLMLMGNFSLDDLIARGLLLSTDCSALMLMEHKESEEIFTVRVTSVADVATMNKQGLVLRAREITRSLEPSFFVPGVLKSFKDSRVLAEVSASQTKQGLVLRARESTRSLKPSFFVPGVLKSIKDWLSPFDELSSIFVAASIVVGLEHLHWSHVMYRGLSVQLVDFRFARKNEGRAFTLCGNPEYLAPEVVENKGHTESVDLWSLGVVIYCLLSGGNSICSREPTNIGTPIGHNRCPMSGAPGDDELRIFRKITARNLVFPPHFSPLACDLIEKLLQKDPQTRLGHGPLGMGAIKAHPWFSPIDWEALLEHRHPPPPGIRERIYNFEGVAYAHFDPKPYEAETAWINNF